MFHLSQNRTIRHNWEPSRNFSISLLRQTNKTDAIVYGYRELTTHNPARRTFVLDITWKFNEARSKYRGSGAGEKQKARM